MLTTNRNGVVTLPTSLFRQLTKLNSVMNANSLCNRYTQPYYYSDDFWEHYKAGVNPRKDLSLSKRDFFIREGIPDISVSVCVYAHPSRREEHLGQGLVVNAKRGHLFYIDGRDEPFLGNRVEGYDFMAYADLLSQSWQALH